MSASPGKVQVLGVADAGGEKVIELRFIQGRNPDWVHRPFFAQYNENATWLNQLKPAFGEQKFFFENELESFYRENLDTGQQDDFEWYISAETDLGEVVFPSTAAADSKVRLLQTVVVASLSN